MFGQFGPPLFSVLSPRLVAASYSLVVTKVASVRIILQDGFIQRTFFFCM